MLHKIFGKSNSRVKIPDARIAPIIADGAIATIAIGHGRLIPLVILDVTDIEELEEAIRLHAYFQEGDVVIRWGMLVGRNDYISLILDFKRPALQTVIIEFHTVSQGIAS